MSLPAEIMQTEDADIDANFQQYSVHLSKLTTLQRALLFELIQNMLSEDKKTDIAIAKKLDIDKSTIWLARQNYHFSQALALMTVDLCRGIADRTIGNLINLKDNVKAQEILLRIAEIYNPTQRILALSGKLPASQPINSSNPRSILAGIVERFSQLGYEKTRLVQEISDIYDELKESGQI